MKQRFQWSIAWKVNGLVIASFIVCVAILVITNQMNRHASSEKIGALTAQIQLYEHSEDFHGLMEHTNAMLYTLRSVLLEGRSSGELSREAAVRLLTEELKRSPKLLGVYTLWESDAFDRNDRKNRSRSVYDDDTGRFIPYVFRTGKTIAIEPLKDYEQAGAGDYYQLPKKSKKLELLEPYQYEAGSEKVLITSMVLPILDANGTFLGIVGADILLSDLQKEVEKVNPFGGYGTMITSGGLYAAHARDPQLVTKPYAGDPTILKNAAGSVTSLLAEEDGGKVLKVVAPVPLQGLDKPWYMEAIIPEANLHTDFYEKLIDSLLKTAFLLVIMVVLVYVMIQRLVIRRLKAVNELSKVMAQGNFTQSLQLTSRDEFGTMAEHFNQMIHHVRDMTYQVTDHANSISATSEQLAASAEQTSRATELIVQSIESVAEGAETQRQSTGEASRAMSEMATGIQRVTESTALVSGAVEEAAKSTTVGHEAIKRTIGYMNELEESVSEASELMSSLHNRSEKIGGIVSVISSISAQTNLLSLNAAIEAARAGESGRGFAVVSGEIRKLSEQTKQAAEEIAQLVDTTVRETMTASRAMETGKASVTRGVGMMHESGEHFEAIMLKMQRIQSQMMEVSAVAEQMSAGSEQVAATVEQLADIASQASANSTGVAAASEQQMASMQEISASAAALNQLVEELVTLMNRFKV